VLVSIQKAVEASQSSFRNVIAARTVILFEHALQNIISLEV
jgi:hypothetical protein